MGFIAGQRGDLKEARRLHESALAVRRQHGSDDGIVISLQALGKLAFECGDRTGGRELQQQALALARELGDSLAIANCLNALASAYVSDRQLASGREHLEEALALLRRLRDPVMVANLLDTYVMLARAELRMERAARLADAAARLRQPLEYRVQDTLASSSSVVALSWAPGDWQLAEQAIAEALE